jgi:plastocyanin
MRRKLLPAAALVCAVLTPALALGQSTATFTATDPYAWSANGTGSNTLTITAPGTVTFEYPAGPGTNGHNVTWEDTPQQCDPSIPGPGMYGRRGWKGTCMFSAPGTYRFECTVHVGLMKGTVVVVAAPTPTPESTPTTPGATPTPTPTADPQPTPTTPTGPPAQPKGPLTARVAASQKGTSVRGSVMVATPASRLEVTVTLGKQRVGRYVKAAAASGKRTFTVKLSPSARRQLERHSLKLQVLVAVGTEKRTFSVRLRR